MTKDEAVSELLSRRELLAEYPFSDSAERRGQRGSAWPPHLVIGKKIYYRRQSVERWLADQSREPDRLSLSARKPMDHRNRPNRPIGQRPAAI